MDTEQPHTHPFLEKPYRTVIAYGIPITLSMVAEPITGLVDTGFVAQLGAAPLAALGVGTTALSTVLWIFAFLGVSTQTEVAKADGRNDRRKAAELTTLALIIGIVAGIVLAIIGLIGARYISRVLGATGDVQRAAVLYMSIRLAGVPAFLISMIGFGALRGLQDMKTPLYVAVGVNGMNILLDAALIPGFGFIPAMGIRGAAIATVFSQWVGALWILVVVFRGIGFSLAFKREDVTALLKVGGDLFVRTGLIILFIFLTTRVANQIGIQAGAAHQTLRTLFILTALLLDGVALTGQSLVAYFLGRGDPKTARHVALVCVQLGLSIGVGLTIVLIAASELVANIFVPATALPAFRQAWILLALSQPIAALSFATDGIHWGTGDYAYLRNTMIIGTLSGVAILLMLNPQAPAAFRWVWVSFLVMLSLRSVLGVVRIWPGIGRAPLSAVRAST